MSQTIGILGGMGPEATVHMFNLFVKLTKAGTDREHIPIIVCNDPKIPDRTAAILHGGPSPLPALVEGVEAIIAGCSETSLVLKAGYKVKLENDI